VRRSAQERSRGKIVASRDFIFEISDFRSPNAGIISITHSIERTSPAEPLATYKNVSNSGVAPRSLRRYCWKRRVRRARSDPASCDDAAAPLCLRTQTRERQDRMQLARPEDPRSANTSYRTISTDYVGVSRPVMFVVHAASCTAGSQKTGWRIHRSCNAVCKMLQSLSEAFCLCAPLHRSMRPALAALSIYVRILFPRYRLLLDSWE